MEDRLVKFVIRMICVTAFFYGRIQLMANDHSSRNEVVNLRINDMDASVLVVNSYFSPPAYKGPVLFFVNFTNLPYILVFREAKKSLILHIFPSNDAANKINWINNQHSDAIFPDVIEPAKHIDLSRFMKIPTYKFVAETTSTYSCQKSVFFIKFPQIVLDEFRLEKFQSQIMNGYHQCVAKPPPLQR